MVFDGGLAVELTFGMWLVLAIKNSGWNLIMARQCVGMLIMLRGSSTICRLNSTVKLFRCFMASLFPCQGESHYDNYSIVFFCNPCLVGW